MSRLAAPSALACCLLACAFLGGCAAPGEPTPRRPVVPLAVNDLAARQSGKAVALTFTLPTRSMDREPLPEMPGVEIYRAALALGAAPDKQTAWRQVYTIPPEKVDSYLRGEQIEFRDSLSTDDFARAAGSAVAYKVRTRAVRARASQDSNVVLVRIYAAPEAPRDVRVTVTEPALIVTWTEAAVPPGASSRGYRVYRAKVDSQQEGVPVETALAKAKTPPELVGSSSSTELRDARFEFGATYLYTVRSVAQFGGDLAESDDSPPASVTPRDVFPPAAPAGLEAAILPATAEAPSYVELSWAISPEVDLAGYFVYRGDREDAVGDRINAEILPSPTFRDMSVLPGRRYYYRVSAVDRAGNESPKSSAAQADVP